jgi:hypothetical protein
LKSKGKALTGAVIGGIVILITLIIFFFGSTKAEKESVDIAALIMVLFSEIVLFGGIAALNLFTGYKDRIFIKSSIITTLFLYWAAAVIFSLLSCRIYAGNVSGFVTVHLAVFGIALIILILIAVSFRSVSENDPKIINSGALIKKCENTAKLLSTNTNYVKYRDALNRVYEDIKYSDKTVEVEEDKLISSQLSVLSEKLSSDIKDGSKDINNSIEIIKQIVRQRELTIRELKRGGI